MHQTFRITGIEPPKDIPRDSAGHENPSAFFDEADSTTATASQSQSQLGASPASKHTGEDKTGRARERPDRFNEIGERGRLVFSLFSVGAAVVMLWETKTRTTTTNNKKNACQMFGPVLLISL